MSAPGPELDADLSGEVMTITELNQNISTVIKQAVRDELTFDYLIGDVSNDSVSNGTRYFQLVNDDAGMQCLAFQGVRDSLPEFEEGDRVAVKGRLSYYEARSNCSIYVDDVVLIGDSLYHREIEKLREKLSEEGLFDESRKKQLPKYPRAIGLVTSKDSDAEKDAIKSIHTQHPDVDIHLKHSSVQGIAALEELCNAITLLDSHKHIDVIVVTRGGGSEQDLHAFNTEGVSRIIDASETPVVTAIGHENDSPIVDQVADTRAMTPTEIGSVVVPSKTQLKKRVSQNEARVKNRYETFITNRINTHQAALDTAYEQYTVSELTALQNDVDNLYQTVTEKRVSELRNQLDTSYTVFKQERQHEEQTESLEKQMQQYKIAAIVLAILVFFAILLGIFFYL